LQNAIAKTNNSLYILVYEFREQSREHTAESDTFVPPEFRDLTPDQLDSLRKLVMSRIENWAKNGSLITHPRLIAILFAWRDWGGEENCQRFVAEATNTDKGLLSFLTVALDKPISEAMTEYHHTPEWEKYLDDINAFIPVNQLEPRAKALFEDDYFDKLKEKEQLALMIFLDLIKSQNMKSIRKTSA